MRIALTIFSLVVLFISSCNKADKKDFFIEIDFKRPLSLRFLEDANLSQKGDLSEFIILEKGSSTTQLMLSSESDEIELFSIPELYSESETILFFKLSSSIDSLKSLSLVQMNGSSGHYVLKNAKILETIYIPK